MYVKKYGKQNHGYRLETFNIQPNFRKKRCRGMQELQDHCSDSHTSKGMLRVMQQKASTSYRAGNASC